MADQDSVPDEVTAIARRHGVYPAQVREVLGGVANRAFVLGENLFLRISRPGFERDLLKETQVVPLARSVGVLTPDIIEYDDTHQLINAPYVVMQRIHGVEPASVPTALAEQLATLHQLHQPLPGEAAAVTTQAAAARARAAEARTAGARAVGAGATGADATDPGATDPGATDPGATDAGATAAAVAGSGSAGGAAGGGAGGGGGAPEAVTTGDGAAAVGGGATGVGTGGGGGGAVTTGDGAAGVNGGATGAGGGALGAGATGDGATGGGAAGGGGGGTGGETGGGGSVVAGATGVGVAAADVAEGRAGGDGVGGIGVDGGELGVDGWGDPWGTVEGLVERGYVDSGTGIWLADWFKRLAERIDGSGPNVLIHGDVAAHNLLAGPENELRALIDWGDAAWAPPAMDFAKLPLTDVALILPAYLHHAPSPPVTGRPSTSSEEEFAAAVLWFHLSWALAKLQADPWPGQRHWTAPTTSRLLGVLQFFTSSPPAPWSDLV